MVALIQPSRRSFLGGLAAALAAPAIVKVSSLMPVRATVIRPSNNALLTIDQLTQEVVRLFAESNAFLEQINEQYARNMAFYQGEQWGSQLRIRLPNDYVSRAA